MNQYLSNMIRQHSKNLIEEQLEESTIPLNKSSQAKAAEMSNFLRKQNKSNSVDSTFNKVQRGEETPPRLRTLDSDGGLTFGGGLPFRISAASESDNT